MSKIKLLAGRVDQVTEYHPGPTPPPSHLLVMLVCFDPDVAVAGWRVTRQVPTPPPLPPWIPSLSTQSHLLIHVLVQFDPEVAVVHHAHQVPGQVAGLSVHAAVPGTHKHLTGARKLNSLDVKAPEHPAPVLACRDRRDAMLVQEISKNASVLGRATHCARLASITCCVTPAAQ